jgi:hypothetical protein
VARDASAAGVEIGIGRETETETETETRTRIDVRVHSLEPRIDDVLLSKPSNCAVSSRKIEKKR